MTQQVEAEAQTAMALRTSARDTLAKAFAATGNLFPVVPAQPFLNAPQGPQGFPSTTAMETKALTYYGTDTPPGTAQDTIALQKQINVLEAYRRAYLGARQTKRDMLAHLAYEFTQADMHDAAALKAFIDADKVRTS